MLYLPLIHTRLQDCSLYSLSGVFYYEDLLSTGDRINQPKISTDSQATKVYHKSRTHKFMVSNTNSNENRFKPLNSTVQFFRAHILFVFYLK